MEEPLARVAITLQGAVQGVGFRPFVYRLAEQCGVAGWVRNDSAGLAIEIEGPESKVNAFRARLEVERPRRAIVHSSVTADLAPRGECGFAILPSEHRPEHTTFVLSDLATCAECLADVLNPADRHYRYPFTNCTLCGPRASIVEQLPYDRARTTMRQFPMCVDCRREYADPRDRRFHAQPNACPQCGPEVAWTTCGGQLLCRGEAALEAAVAAIDGGQIVAVKGQGGFHLFVDAANEASVARLRELKGRAAKPLAIMVRDMNMAEQLCEVPPLAAEWMLSPTCPIMLLPRRPGDRLSQSVAFNNPRLGVMLPAMPLHHLLLRALARPLVATSGNVSDEPICTSNAEAYQRLGGIADGFLVHNRDIAHHLDDSVMIIAAQGPMMLRRARGAAPQPITVGGQWPCMLALGADGKNTVALSLGRQVVVSQHLGDLDQLAGLEVLERVVGDLLTLHRAQPVLVAHDLHPGYYSTRWLQTLRQSAPRPGEAPWRGWVRGARLLAVQHHHAHLAACLAEHHEQQASLGAIWDGTGYAPDGTVWGGEFLYGNAQGFQRVAYLRPFPLLGGEAAVRDTRRIALALLHEACGQRAWQSPLAAQYSPAQQQVFRQMLTSGRHIAWSSSLGRLFDGVAALLGLCTASSFEGQAAMSVEWAAAPAEQGVYAWELKEAEGQGRGGAEERGSASKLPQFVVDWRGTVRELAADVDRGTAADIAAARFHNTLVQMLLAVASRYAEVPIVLSGGCFQNQRLTEHAFAALTQHGRRVLLPRQLPPNDGGISFGQLAVAAGQPGTG